MTKDPTACIINFDIEGILKSIRPKVGQEAKERTAFHDRLRVILSILLTPGLHAGIDSICRDRLNIPASATSVCITKLVTFSTSGRASMLKSRIETVQLVPTR